MFRFIWRQLRGRGARSVALLVGVLVATTGFVVLTGATTTSRLQLGERVERETRAAYDILVRPKGSRTPQEADRGVVRPNYLSGLFGGITQAQYEQVRAVPGVDIAAPVAMVGYSIFAMEAEFDLTATVDRSVDHQVIRVDPTFLAERGLSRAVARPRYVYLTRNPLTYPVAIEDGNVPDPRPYTDGNRYSSDSCGNGWWVPREIFPDGHTEPVCNLASRPIVSGSTVTNVEHTEVLVARLLPDGRFENSPHSPAVGSESPANVTDRLVLPVRWHVPFLLAAVDPAAEDRLLGLTDAVVEGRPLRADEQAIDFDLGGFPGLDVPVLATSRPYVDGTVGASYTRLRPDRVAGVGPDVLARTLPATAGEPVGTGSADLADTYQARIRSAIGAEHRPDTLLTMIQAGPPEYDILPDGTLRPRTVPGDPEVYGIAGMADWPAPWLAGDTSFRPLRRLVVQTINERPSRGWRPVGMFDPERLAAFGGLSEVPLETYQPPVATGADEASRAALGDRPLLPSGNPGGYLSSPPLLLTSLAALPKLLAGQGGREQAAAPISAIRIRVAGIGGYTEQSAERVRLTAEQIALRTGLDVDVTFGSSPAPQTVTLPAGTYGRPDLRLTEDWSALGVASVIVRAVDRKSIGLFLLVLVVCALFLANAVSAAVRDRRSELAVLACLGWPARRIGAAIVGEVAALGLAAGLLGLALSTPLAALLDLDVGWRHAALAVPVALGLALAAGAVPALRASRAHPAAALRPASAPARRAHRPRGVLGLALANLVRVPGRTALGAVALGIGVAALTMLAGINHAFQGTVVGSLLGDTVSLTVRTADTTAALATTLLGAVAVADVLYLNIRDRAAELATLRATGWTEPALARLAAYEGVGIGLLGATTGAALGLAGTAALVGGLGTGLLVTAVVTAVAGTLLAGLAALVPAVLLRRLPTARLLAEE
ncbi:FtsX-like permease family protein [Plantactinospora solaniradicis]|uniref:FtsX-like permease family protein n=1 Tax=Plantactinospora solaniradicis TaxID=1723736 RepID=A0ABW1K6C2_9ACTN